MCFPLQSLRYVFFLGGKRRLRCQLYACGKISPCHGVMSYPTLIKKYFFPGTLKSYALMRRGYSVQHDL